jgi:hypothetical protein
MQREPLPEISFRFDRGQFELTVQDTVNERTNERSAGQRDSGSSFYGVDYIVDPNDLSVEQYDRNLRPFVVVDGRPPAGWFSPVSCSLLVGALADHRRKL